VTKSPTRLSSWEFVAALLFGGVSAALAAYTLAVEPYQLETTTTPIYLSRLPRSLKGLSILLLTDTHIGKWGRREPLLINALKTMETPEMIIWAGDFLQGETGIIPALKICRLVRDRFPGVPAYAVFGNAEHKIKIDKRKRFMADLRDSGIRLLDNEHLLIAPRPGSEEIVLAGVDDPYYGFADLQKALKNAPVETRFTLLLAHSPQIAVQAAQAGVDLMLSGHTHGGQVQIPLIGALKTQNPLSRRMDFGLWDRHRLARILGRDPGGDLQTFISRGIGVATVPRAPLLAPRLLCRPEIACITLHGAKP
jgi:predicted MPP superfamily phosphohydrolase